MKYRSLFLFVCLLAASAQAQLPVSPALLKGSWPASWVTCPDAAQREYGIYHFRKSFSLGQQPGSFVVHVSADNRYRLFVNGQAVCSGPARGDLYNWYFETVDIAPYLHAGTNVIAAQVWNMGVFAPVAQISNQTAFVLQGDGAAEKIVNTGEGWKAFQNTAYKAVSTDNSARMHSYMVVGPGDQVDAALYPWGWELPDYDDGQWRAAKRMMNPVTAGYGSDNLWTLQPRNIPLMFERLQRIGSIRRAKGIVLPQQLLAGNHPVEIPAGTTVSLLLDQGYNTVAYPELVTSKGKGASVKLTYAEALLNKDGSKGNRNEIEGKEIRGNYDIFLTGGQKRHFRPLWFRTYRFIQVDITTAEEPLLVEDLYGTATGYPFQVKAAFNSSDASLQQIWDIGWRTAQLCAGETYFDCPYYEQLQYEGDTRIQSLISLYVTGDDRLMRKALLDFYHSRVPEGLTQGRYPSSRLQVIPPFSLYWVSMIHDYWMHRPDQTFVAAFLQAAAGVLDWYEKKIDTSKNMLGPMKWWGFTDWNHAFPGGTPDGAEEGNSAVISLQYVYTLQQAAALFAAFGRKYEAEHYRRLANTVSAAVYRLCFDPAKGEMANTPFKKTFSQHASIMAVLTGTIPAAKRQAVMQKVLYDSTLSQATFYYRFYLTRALKKAGMADLYYSQLAPWRGMIANGLTTFAENPDPTRSDCHAWSSSPNYDFLATICGIRPASPGFATVTIEPAMGELQRAEGVLPHPRGDIHVTLERKGQQGIQASIVLPAGLNGQFIWQGKKQSLHGGEQKIIL